jgi:hypothetical protein
VNIGRARFHLRLSEVRVDRSPCLLALLLMTASWPARAQVSGRVTDAQGAALQGAAVELWQGESRTAARVADAAGRFVFTAAESGGASGLLVRHPGFRVARVRITGPGEIAVRLAAQPVMIEGVTARAARRRLCPNRETAEARALWAAAAAKYSRALDSLGVGTLFGSDERTVATESEVGPVSSATLRRGNAVGYPAHAWPYFWHVERSGYAGRLTGASGYSEFGAWYYPLDVLPSHFSSESFGALHTFHVAGRDGSEVEIGFCPRPGTLPGMPRIQGTLRISMVDTLLTDVHYEFRTPAPDERAGAEIVYAPAAGPDGRPLPVPATELFWRRPAGRTRVYQRYREYTRWQLSASDSSYIPPIPTGSPPPQATAPGTR